MRFSRFRLDWLNDGVVVVVLCIYLGGILVALDCFGFGWFF